MTGAGCRTDRLDASRPGRTGDAELNVPAGIPPNTSPTNAVAPAAGGMAFVECSAACRPSLSIAACAPRLAGERAVLGQDHRSSHSWLALYWQYPWPPRCRSLWSPDTLSLVEQARPKPAPVWLESRDRGSEEWGCCRLDHLEGFSECFGNS